MPEIKEGIKENPSFGNFVALLICMSSGIFSMYLIAIFE